ncbi:twin-arginine translocase subunit TatC [Bryobacter aggregatus]|uniref:twin-arginine translocase subunit TatC n=1 Tax=Bryobacter aggregatus TaxID=360054 RepID=UPI00068EDA72|nr:twin-arginine translocase subunit TatC [Bryobacter aggregatus]
MPQDEQDKKSVPAYDHPGGADSHGHYQDEHAYDPHASTELVVSTPSADETSAYQPPPPPPPPPASEEEDEEDDGMLRMSFLDHLEELRSRLIKAVVGLVVTYGFCLLFAGKLWEIVSEPAAAALRAIGAKPDLAQLDPMDGFLVVYFKLPLLAAVFIASPWILWQVWSFVAPGLYKNERKLAVPFVFSTAGLFILGGCFAYFVAFRFGLAFLLGIGMNFGQEAGNVGAKIVPVVSIVSYFDLFVNVMLGISATFELPVLIFFLTMLRIVTPGFLIEHSRYAILGITILAAVITPTPDIVNLLIFAIPMILLYFIGVFAGYLLVLSREGRKFPWHILWIILASIAILSGAAIAVMVKYYGFKLIGSWPYLTQ